MYAKLKIKTNKKSPVWEIFYLLSLIFSTNRFFRISRKISAPMIPPRVFNIRSSISVLLPTKYCAVSIKSEKKKVNRIPFTVLPVNKDARKPTGTKSPIFPSRFIQNE